MWLDLAGDQGSRRAASELNLERSWIMKKLMPLLTLTLAALAIAPLARAQAGTDADAIKSKLKQMEDVWEKAQMDKDHGAAAVAPLLAEDYAGVNTKGEKQSKAQSLEEMRKNTDS